MKKGEGETTGVSLLLTMPAEKEGRAADFPSLRRGWDCMRRNSYVRNASHLEDSYSTALHMIQSLILLPRNLSHTRSHDNQQIEKS